MRTRSTVGRALIGLRYGCRQLRPGAGGGIALLAMACVAMAIPAQAAEKQWKLATSDTSLTIGVRAHRPVIERLECPQVRYNWAGSGMVVPLMSVVAVDGQELRTSWAFTGGALDKGSGKLVLSFGNARPKLVLRSIWRARPGHGPVEHWMEIENLSGKRVMVTHQYSLSLLGLVKPTGLPLNALSVKKGGTNASVEGGTLFERVTSRLHANIWSTPDSGATFVPFVALQAGEKHGLYAGWEFSAVGGVKVDGSDRTVDVQVGNRPDFRTDVEPNEVFLVPPAFVGCYAGDSDEGSYTLTRFVAEKLIPPIPREHNYPTVSWNPYIDTGALQTTEASLAPSIALGREMGFETFVVDASWYPQVGDWRWEPTRFPHGGRPMADQAHRLGMGFGMWCAWGQGGLSEEPDAASIRGSAAHPDWFNVDVGADWRPPNDIAGAQLCMACQDAREWAMGKTTSLIDTYTLDFLKHDCGPIVTTCTKTGHKHHYGVDVSYWATLGYYEVMNNILRKCPDTVLENCSGGGIIKDFGTARVAHYICGTDTLQSLIDRRSAYDTTWVLPPASVLLYTYENSTPVASDKPGPFLWRSAMMGSWVIAPTNTAGWTPEIVQSVKRATSVYKTWIRPIIRNCKVYHILPRPTDTDWDGLFYWSPAIKRGTVYIFRPDTELTAKTVKLKGLDSGKRYWVWGEDGSLAAGVRTGSELMGKGLTFKLPGKYTSDLVYVQDASLGKPKGLDAPGDFGGLKADAASDYATASATLAWQPSANAISYRVAVSDSPDFGKLIYEGVVTEPGLALAKLPSEKSLYYRVEAIGWGGRRMSSPARFTTPKLKVLPGIAFVSDMEWTKATCGSTFVRRDENYLGQSLRIGQKSYPKGLWNHAFNEASAPADVTVNTAGRGFARFVADCGVDGASQGGTVQFQVLVDGVVKAESSVLRKNASHRFEVDITGAKEVTLRVLNGGDSHTGDHAAWGMARFVGEGSEDPL